MKKIVFSISLLFCAVISTAQTTVHGSIVTGKNKKAVKGANISVVNTYDGATSDSLGNFSFVWEDTQSDSLLVTALDFIPFSHKLQKDKKDIQLHIELLPEISELNAVVVSSAGSFMTGNNQKGVVVMTSLDVVTTAQNADITSALKFLPGAQQVGETEGLFVRGGTGTETKQYIDGAVVHKPYFKGENPNNRALPGEFFSVASIKLF